MTRLALFQDKRNMGKTIVSLVSNKWVLIIALEIVVGLLCIFIPWYIVAIISIMIALLALWQIEYQWWAYALMIIVPLVGVKYPGVYIKGGGFSQVEAIPLFLIVSIIPIIPIVVHIAAKLRTNHLRNPLSVPILLLVSYSLLTFLWSPANASFNLFYFLLLGMNVVIFYVIFMIVDGQEMHRKLMWCLVISGVILAIQIIIFYWWPFNIEKQIHLFGRFYLDLNIGASVSDTAGTIRGEGFFMGTLESATILAFITIVACGLLLHERQSLKRGILFFLVIFFIFAQFLIKSKSGVWALFLMMYLFLFLSLRLRKMFWRLAVGIFAVFVMCFAIVGVITPEKKESRVVTVQTTQGSSMALRWYYWTEGFKQLSKKSLTPAGLGIGGYKYCTLQKRIPHAHNLYLSLFFDFGVMGLIVVVTMMFILAGYVFRLLRIQTTYFQTMSLAFSVILFGLSLISLVYIPYYMSFLWVFLALSCATLSLAQKELERKNILGKIPVASHPRAPGEFD